MSFEIPLRLAAGETLIVVDGRRWFSGHELDLTYRGDDDGTVGVDVRQGSRLWLAQEGEDRQDVIFEADTPLLRLNIEALPPGPEALAEMVRAQVSAQVSAMTVTLPSITGTGHPVADYLVCVGFGVAQDLINAILECRRGGARGIKAMLACLKGKGLDIGLAVLGRLLRCLTRLAGA